MRHIFVGSFSVFLIILTIFFALSCEKNKYLSVIIDNRASENLYIDFLSYHHVVDGTVKKYIFSDALNIVSDSITKEPGVFDTTIRAQSKKVFRVYIWEEINSVLYETLPADPLLYQKKVMGVASELLFLLYYCKKQYKYSNYSDYVSIIKNDSSLVYGKYIKPNTILFTILE